MHAQAHLHVHAYGHLWIYIRRWKCGTWSVLLQLPAHSILKIIVVIPLFYNDGHCTVILFATNHWPLYCVYINFILLLWYRYLIVMIIC